jgi:YggT family protein
MYMIAELLTSIISVMIFFIFIQVVVQWLVIFEVLKVRTPQAQNLVNLLNNYAEMLYRPLRKYIPPVGGIDLTPIVVIIGLQLLASLIWRIAAGF